MVTTVTTGGTIPTMTAQLSRLVLTFRDGEIVVHTLYRTKDGPNPNTKKRLGATTELVRGGLIDALKALESEASEPPVCVGTSGFTQREDVLLIDTVEMQAQLGA